MDSPHSPTPIEGEQQSLDSPDSSQSSGLSFGHRRNLLPTRRLIDFEPLRQPNTTYQHGRDSPVWGQQQPLHPRDALELPQPSFQPEDPFLSARRPIDFEPLRQPSPTYQHGRNSPVWGQQKPLDSPDAPELPQPSFQSEDPFLQTRRLLDFELFRQPNASPRHGQGFPFWGQEQYFETPDALSPPEFDIVYSNGWIHEIPIRPMDYEYRMLPIQPSPQGRDSPVSGGSEPLSINGPDPFQDTRKSKRRITHGRSMSIERACKAWAYELANSAPNSNQIDANTKDLFASLENLVLRLVNNQPSTEAPPQPSVKRPPNRYKISKRTRDEPPEPRVDVEDLPYWLRPRLGIRLPPGMVNLLQLHLPVYLVREFEDPLRYLPSKLSFKENSPFGTVIPKKGQVGIHPAFRTVTPEDILMAEKALELSKERQFLTPEEAWRSPIVEDRNSDAGSGSLTAYKPMTDDGTAGSTNKFQGFEHWRSENENHTLTTDDCTTGPANKSQGVEHWELENHSCSVDGERSKPKSSEHEAFSDFDQALIFSDQGMESPIEDQASVCLNQSMEFPDIGPVTMFSGRDIETDQGSIFLSQGMQTPIVGPVSMLYSLDMESPIEDQVAMASDQGMESPIENQDSEYFGQGMEYLIEDVVSRYFRDSTESPAEDQVSVYSDQLEAFPDVDPALMFYGQDIEHLVEDQDSMPSTISIESPLLMHEGIPIIRWFYESGDGNSGSLGQPSSNQGKKTKEYYKRNSADFAHLPPIDFTKSYKHFCTTPFGNLVTDGGLEDYNSTDEETVQKTTEVTENPRVPTDTYGPEDHEARMQDLFAEIEQEGAARILTTWQEVYAERAEEEGTEEEQAEAALEDSQEKITHQPKIIQEPAVSLEQRRSKTKSWFEGLPAEKEDIKERRTQGAELELNGKRISWPGGLASARDGQTQESFEDSIGYVTQGPADLLVQKNSKRVTWFGGLPADRQKRTDEAFGDSQEKIDPGLGHPLERKRSKRTSWFGGHPAKNEERSKENLGGGHEKLTPASVHPLERKGSKRRSWFPGHSAERVEQTKENLEDSHEKLTPASVHPLERKASKRRSWFPGHSAERVEQTKEGLEDSQGKLTPASVHPMERKASKRRSWLPGHSAERVEQAKEGLEDSQGKLTPASVHPMERKASKRRSWLPGHSAERVEQAKEGLEGSQGKLTPASVHPLERKSSKRRSWFPGHPAEREGRASEDSHGKLIHGNVHPLERKGSKRRSWFPGHSVEGEGRTSEDSYGKLTQGSVNPLERKGSKRRSWFPGHPVEGEGRASEDSHGKSTQGNVHPLERKASKRKTWFGGLPPEREERTEDALEDSHGKVTQEPVHPLERKRSKRMSWFGGVPAKRDEQTHEAFEGSTETTGQGPAEPSEQMRAKRVSWFGGLPTQRERTERRTTQGGQEERKRKRTSWFA